MSTRAVPPPDDENAPSDSETFVPGGSNLENGSSTQNLPPSDFKKPVPRKLLKSGKLSRLDGYEVGTEIGRGGMGIVYEAVEVTLQRRVALKMLPVAAQLDEMQALRFRNESRAAAQLNHPNIVPVFAVGECDGIHYFAMQLVKGQNLSQLIKSIRHTLTVPPPASRRDPADEQTPNDFKRSTVDDNARPNMAPAAPANSDSRNREGVRLSAADFTHRSGGHSTSVRAAHAVARIGMGVADALQHAHDAGVVHRDIKPSNLMLDQDGKMWVTDFGLAQIRNAPSITRTGVLMGTLRYMSPEQASGVRALVDHRTDIYSLGVTLYEMLTLRRLVRGTGTEEILQQVVYGAPVSIRRIDSAVPEDLAIILETAMSKNPLERYSTAGEMAADLNRFLKNDPIKARRPAMVKRCRQWLSRHKAVATATMVASVMVFLSSVIATGMIWNALQAETIQRERTEEALSESEGLRLLANASLELPDNPGLSLALAVKGASAVPGLEANRVLQAAMDANHEAGTVRPREKSSGHVVISPDGEMVVTCVATGVQDSGSFPAMIHSMRDGSLVRELDSGDCITSATYSPSGRYVLTTSRVNASSGNPSVPQAPTLWVTATGQKVRTLSDAILLHAHASMFHPDDSRLVVCEGNDAVVHSIADSRELLVLRGHTDRVVYAEFSPDGDRILTASEDRSVRVWSSVDGKEQRPAIGWDHDDTDWLRASFVASSDYVILRDRDSVRLYPTVVEKDESVAPKAATGNGRIGVSVSRTQSQIAVFDGTSVTILSSNDLDLICNLDVPPELIVTDLHFHPKLSQVLVVYGKRMFLYDSETGVLLGRFNGHESPVVDVCMSEFPPGIATVAKDNTLRFWRNNSGLSRRTFHTAAQNSDIIPSPVALSPGDELLAVESGTSYETRLWTLDGDRIPGGFSGYGCRGPSLNNRLVSVIGKTVVVNEVSTSRELYRGRFSDRPTPETMLLDEGRHLFVQTDSLQAFHVNVASNSRRRLGLRGEFVSATRISADASVIFLGTRNGRLLAFDAANGMQLWARQHVRPIVDIDVTSDRQRLVFADSTGGVELWKTDGTERLALIEATETSVNRVRFFDNGSRFVTWHTRNNQLLRCYETNALDSVAELPAKGGIRVHVDPKRPLIAIGTSNSAILWNVTDDASREISDRRCSSLCMTEDRIALLLTRSATDPASLQVHSLQNEEMIHSQALVTSPFYITTDNRREHFVLTEKGYSSQVFEFPSGKPVCSSPPHPAPIVWAGFLKEPLWLVTVSEDGVVLVSDRSGKIVHRFSSTAPDCTSAALSPDGELLLVGASDGSLVLWSVSKGTAVTRLAGHSAPIKTISFDQHSKKVVTLAANETIRLWDLRTQESTTTDVENAIHVELSRTGDHTLVVAGKTTSSNNSVWLIDNLHNTLTEIPQDKGTRAARFSSDGRSLGLLRADGQLDVKNLETGVLEARIPGSADRAISFAFAPQGDGVLLAHPRRCSLWSLDSATELLTFEYARGQMRPHKSWQPFSHDAKWIIANNPQVQKWSRRPTEIATQSWPRNLTKEERQRYRIDLIDSPSVDN